MKFFSIVDRALRPTSILPHVRVGVAHLTGPGTLHATENHLVFEVSETRQIRLDISSLKEVVAYGDVLLTSSAMALLDSNHISMTWLNTHGTFVQGRMSPSRSDRVLGRLLQFQAWEDRTWQLFTAKRIVASKLESIHSALRHYQRQGKTLSQGALTKITESLEACDGTSTVDQLRGVEGFASSLWFSEFAGFFARDWTFTGRNRRPPKDPINSLLSLGYMQLYRRVVSRIEACGYEAALGALHEFRPGRQSMACDIMEPMRIPVVDRWVLSVCSQGILKKSDFESTDAGAVLLARGSLGKVLTRLESHWHQGNSEQILENELRQWIESIRQHVGKETSRASAYLKARVRRESHDKGSGEPEDDDL